MVWRAPAPVVLQDWCPGLSAFPGGTVDEEQWLTYTASDSRRSSASRYDSEAQPPEQTGDTPEAPRRPTTMHRVKPGDKTGPGLLVPATTIRDKHLTPNAFYLLCWMLDHPETWNFQINYVWENSSLSRDQVYAAIKLLREHRYCLRRGTVDEKGHKCFRYEWFAFPYPTLEESVMSAVTAKAEVILDFRAQEQEQEQTDEDDDALRAPTGETELVDMDGVSLHGLSALDSRSWNPGLPLQKQLTQEYDETPGQPDLDRSSSDDSAVVTNPLQKKPPQRHENSRTDLLCRLGRCQDPQEHESENDKNRAALNTVLAKSA